MRINFDFLQSPSLLLVFHALKFIYWMIDNEENLPLIDHVMQPVLRSPENYERGGIFHRIFTVITEKIDISDFQKLFLRFFQKFLKLQFSFLAGFFQNILEQKTAKGFRQLSYVWSCTAAFKSADCRNLLQMTVYEMLQYKELRDPVIRNYLKRWLYLTQENFSIILNTVLKEIMRKTNWVIVNKQIFYNYPFDCAALAQNLDHLKTLLDYGSNFFVNFIKCFDIAEEFDYFLEEVNDFMKVFYIEESKKYLSLILRVLMRYVIGELNEQVTNDAKEVAAHKARILDLKVDICSYIA